MPATEGPFDAIRAEFDRVRSVVVGLARPLHDPLSPELSVAAHAVLGVPWHFSALAAGGVRYPTDGALRSAVRRKLLLVHSDRIATGEGSEHAAQAAITLRAYYERASELLDPSWRARAPMGRDRHAGLRGPFPAAGAGLLESVDRGKQSHPARLRRPRNSRLHVALPDRHELLLNP